MRSDSFSLDVRGFDQRGPFLDLALNKSFEIFGRPAIGRNQNGAELLKGAPRSREGEGPRAWAGGLYFERRQRAGVPTNRPTKKQRPVSKGGET